MADCSASRLPLSAAARKSLFRDSTEGTGAGVAAWSPSVSVSLFTSEIAVVGAVSVAAAAGSLAAPAALVAPMPCFADYGLEAFFIWENLLFVLTSAL